MRHAFHEDLDKISDQLVEMTRLVGSAMSRATTALLDADIQLAQTVIDGDKAIDAMREAIDELAIDLLARQNPVATDLRIIVTGMRMSSDLERMGDLARHIAKVARLRYPDTAVPAEVRSEIVQMGNVAGEIVAKAGSVIASKDVKAAAELDRDDDAMDDLHRDLLARLMEGPWKYGVQSAVDLALIGRYYERFADWAVTVSHRVIYLVTGEWDEGITSMDHEEQEDDATD
jgi:phosphate transport system protein